MWGPDSDSHFLTGETVVAVASAAPADAVVAASGSFLVHFVLTVLLTAVLVVVLVAVFVVSFCGVLGRLAAMVVSTAWYASW